MEDSIHTKTTKGCKNPRTDMEAPPPPGDGVQEEKGKSPRTNIKVLLLLEDEGEGEMFLEMLCHCFCLLGVLGMGQGFMQAVREAFVHRPKPSFTLVCPRDDLKHGRQHS